MCREIENWDGMVQRFKVTFTFEHEPPLLDETLEAMRTNIFSKEGSMEVVSMCNAHRSSMTLHELLKCYNVAKEYQEEDDLRNIQIPETEGEHRA
jgi:hypothetical protein